jgi:hypothetical protein
VRLCASAVKTQGYFRLILYRNPVFEPASKQTFWDNWGREDMRFFSFVVAVLVFTAIPLVADDTPPDAVRDAVEGRYKGVENAKYKNETIDGKGVYTVQFKSKDGTKFHADLTPEGKFIREYYDIDSSDLPKKMKELIETQYPEANIKDARAETVGKASYYVVKIKDKEGKKIDLQITKDSTTITKAVNEDAENKEKENKEKEKDSKDKDKAKDKDAKDKDAKDKDKK